ncbi:MAG: hypothetical protein IPJ67_00310 [Candidatus Moraniibacteriota bacterium]|nr:MAG: hypothetical protein IPJ67_00310 [Candidatus Moranbacteria bacterium]
MPARFFTWIIILFSLTVGAVLWWRLQGKNQGQAAETMNATVPGPTSSILVGHWTLDGNDVVWGDTTSEIKDVSGYAKHGDSSNLTAGSAVVGRIGQGLLFNGSSDSISLGNVYNGVKTVSFWAKPNSTTQPFIDLNGTATINMTSSTVAANNFTSPTIYVDGTATSTFPNTNWHHITVTTGTSINASAAYLGKIASSYFGGILDDLRFYSTELSATQVADLYRSSGAKQTINFGMEGTLTDGLVGHWTMDGNDVIWGDSSSEVKDRSGNGNDGDAVGLTASSAVIGKLGQGLSFDGTSDEISVLGPTITNTHSFVAWIKPSGNLGGYNSLVESDTTFIGVYLQDSSSSQCSFVQTLNFYYSSTSHCSNTEITDDIWTHVAVINNAGSVTFYVNGAPAGTATSAPGYTAGMIGNGNSTSFKGSLDDVRMYNRALSVTEVTNLYTIGK